MYGVLGKESGSKNGKESVVDSQVQYMGRSYLKESSAVLLVILLLLIIIMKY